MKHPALTGKQPATIVELEQLLAKIKAYIADPKAIASAWEPTEIEAVKSELTAFRYESGTGVEANPQLLTRLYQISVAFGRNGFQVARELERMRQGVENGANMPPRTADWFPIVLEARWRRRTEARKQPIAGAARGAVRATDLLATDGPVVDTDALVTLLAREMAKLA